VRLRDSVADRNTVAARRFLHHWRCVMKNNDAEQTDGHIERHAQPNAQNQRICHRVAVCWQLGKSGTIARVDRSMTKHESEESGKSSRKSGDDNWRTRHQSVPPKVTLVFCTLRTIARSLLRAHMFSFRK
jgi:hypothetical protein